MDTGDTTGYNFLKDFFVSHVTCPNFISNEQELLDFGAGADFRPETDRYAVLLVQIERWSSVLSSRTPWLEASKHHFLVLSNMIQETLGRENIAVVGEKDYQMVGIVNLRQDWDAFRLGLRGQLEEIMEVLDTEFGISITCALSQQAQGMSRLPELYAQAREALWYNDFLEDDRQIIFYEDLLGGDLPMIRSELMELDKKLISKLQIGDVAGVKYVLHEMIDREFIQSFPTVKILRTRLGGICCKILDALSELREAMGDEMYYQLDPAPRIVEARSLSELTGNLDEIFDAISSRRDAGGQEPKPQWVDRMSVYIEEHYRNENLGLTEVSAAFGITPSYATRVFKQYTGRGIYETIQHVRLAAAKAMMNSDKTMKQIAQAVGYTSFLSMNRAFKKYEGATPSQFRDQ